MTSALCCHLVNIINNCLKLVKEDFSLSSALWCYLANILDSCLERIWSPLPSSGESVKY